MRLFWLIILAFIFFPSVSLAQGNIFITVPFTSQAPLLEWKDQRFQDACEEASILMAMKWVKGQDITKTSAGKKAVRNEIAKMADWEKKKYGSYRDTSAKDTAERLLGVYYDYHNFEVKEEIKTDDIIAALREGKIVIVPTDGRLLKNPYFTGGGPDRHMLLIKGYDETRKMFITNDPGTRRGENYEYSEAVLFKAIRDYPTGNHLPIKKILKNAIIIYAK